MRCPNCNQEIIAGEAYCDSCGHAIGNAANELLPVPGLTINSTLPASSAAKLVLKDSSTTFDLPPGKTTIIGRLDPETGIYPDIDLTAHDPQQGVSRRHAQVHEQGGQWYIQDMQSSNYTVINRRRLPPGQDFLLEPGDEVRFGRVTATFHSA